VLKIILDGDEHLMALTEPSSQHLIPPFGHPLSTPHPALSGTPLLGKERGRG